MYSALPIISVSCIVYSLLIGTAVFTMGDLFTADMMRVCLEQLITPFRIVWHNKSLRRLEKSTHESDSEK